MAYKISQFSLSALNIHDALFFSAIRYTLFLSHVSFHSRIQLKWSKIGYAWKEPTLEQFLEAGIEMGLMTLIWGSPKRGKPLFSML